MGVWLFAPFQRLRRGPQNIGSRRQFGKHGLRSALCYQVCAGNGGYAFASVQLRAVGTRRARAGEFSTVYVWKLDRLSRSVKGFADLMEEFAAAGTGFASVTENVDYSGSSGRLMMHMLAAVAAFFADLNKERVRAALAHRTQAGLHHGKPPLGYRRSTKGGPLEEDPATAELVREAFRRYAAGDSLAQITQDFNRRGVLRVQGGAWEYTKLKRLLSRRTYLGEVRQGDQWLPGQHPALVNKRTWNRVQERLAANRAIPARSRSNSLSPLLACGYCGGRIDRGSSGGHHRRYYCRACEVHSVSHPPLGAGAAKVEAAIWAYVRWLWEHTDADAELEALVAKRAREKQDGEGAKLRRRLAELDRELAAYLKGFAKGTVPEDVFLATTAPLREERDALAARLNALPRPPDTESLLRDLLAQDAVQTIAKLRTRPADVQVQWLRRLFARVVIEPGALVFYHAEDLLPPWRMALPPLYQPRRGIGVFVMPDGSCAR